MKVDAFHQDIQNNFDMEKYRPRFKEGDVIWTIWKNKAIPLTVLTVINSKLCTYLIREHVLESKPVPQWVDECDAFGSKQEIIDQL